MPKPFKPDASSWPRVELSESGLDQRLRIYTLDPHFNYAQFVKRSLDAYQAELEKRNGRKPLTN